MLSVELGPKAAAAERGKLLPPVGLRRSLRQQQDLEDVFWHQVSKKQNVVHDTAMMVPGQINRKRRTENTNTGCEFEIRNLSPASIFVVIWKTHEKCSCEQWSEGLSPYGNVNNLRLSGVKSYMGMLGMLNAEFLAITDIMIWKPSTQERLFLLFLLLIDY